MIWVAWRRHRLVVTIVLATFVAMAIWMVFVAHTYEAAAVLREAKRCPVAFNGLRTYCTGDQRQAELISLVLLVFPCVIGLVLGAPLIAGEIHGKTNRLSWTQSISRTKWYCTKWVLVGAPLIVAFSLFQLLASWWFGRTDAGSSFNLVPVLGGYAFGRIQPALFAITGIVPIAYALFAFALGVALGAVTRRTSWAVVGTFVVYAGAAFLMVLVVRQNLLPQTFVSDQARSSGSSITSYSGNTPFPQQPWLIGFGYRYDPGFKVPAGAVSADEAGLRCQVQAYGADMNRYTKCISDHRLQSGNWYQPVSHYWPLQLIEGAMYVGASLVLLGAGLWSVRRWRA